MQIRREKKLLLWDSTACYNQIKLRYKSQGGIHLGQFLIQFFECLFAERIFFILKKIFFSN